MLGVEAHLGLGFRLGSGVAQSESLREEGKEKGKKGKDW